MNIIPYLTALGKYVIYGSSVFFTGELNRSTDVLDILALRFLISFLVLWLLKVTKLIRIKVGFRYVVHHWRHEPLIKSLLLAALFEPVLYMLFETAGISMTTNITAAVIISLAPIASCIVETLILKEKSSSLQKIFLLMGILGVVYIAINTDTHTGENSLLGILLLFGAIVVGALFAACSRKASGAFSPMEITYVSCILGAIVFNTINVVRHLCDGKILSYFAPLCNTDNLIGFLFLGVLSTIVATGMGNFSLSHLQMSTIAAFSGVSTLVTILIGVVFAGEQLYPYHYFGLTLILIRMVGVSAISIQQSKQLPEK